MRSYYAVILVAALASASFAVLFAMAGPGPTADYIAERAARELAVDEVALREQVLKALMERSVVEAAVYAAPSLVIAILALVPLCTRVLASSAQQRRGDRPVSGVSVSSDQHAFNLQGCDPRNPPANGRNK